MENKFRSCVARFISKPGELRIACGKPDRLWSNPDDYLTDDTVFTNALAGKCLPCPSKNRALEFLNKLNSYKKSICEFEALVGRQEKPGTQGEGLRPQDTI